MNVEAARLGRGGFKIDGQKAGSSGKERGCDAVRWMLQAVRLFVCGFLGLDAMACRVGLWYCSNECGIWASDWRVKGQDEEEGRGLRGGGGLMS